MSRLADKQQRCELVNQAIRIIASYGRRFFYCKSQDTWASMEVDARGRVWFVDDFTRRRVYTHEAAFGNGWNGFSHGGTLRNLVELFRDFIRTGNPLHPGYLGHERENGSNIWGYDREAIAIVRAQAGALAVFRQQAGGAMMGCCDGWNLDDSEGCVGECPACGEPTVDGTAKSGCSYSPVTCDTCGARPCDESC